MSNELLNNSHPEKQQTRRVFFSLWPDDAIRNQMVEVLKQSGLNEKQGRIVSADNLHITLHFIGNVNHQKLDCMHETALKVKAKGFDLELDHYGYFKKPKVLWMGLEKIPESLKQLHHSLAHALFKCDYQSEKRVYAPHVTLMRKLVRPSDLNKYESIKWQVNDFVLVESLPVEGGVKYKVIEKYVLLDK